jgi:hypothetical protein
MHLQCANARNGGRSNKQKALALLWLQCNRPCCKILSDSHCCFGIANPGTCTLRELGLVASGKIDCCQQLTLIVALLSRMTGREKKTIMMMLNRTAPRLTPHKYLISVLKPEL